MDNPIVINIVINMIPPDFDWEDEDDDNDGGDSPSPNQPIPPAEKWLRSNRRQSYPGGSSIKDALGFIKSNSFANNKVR